MIGTLVNTAAIVVGSLVGGTIRQGLKAKYQEVLYLAMGLAALGIGINSVVQNMPNSSYPVLFIASLAIGGVIGCGIDLDGRFNRMVNRRSKGGSAAGGSGDDAQGASVSNDLGRGLSTGIMLFCVGALSILGPIESALHGNETLLFTNATLDLVTSMVLASTYGFGMIFAAVALFAWQGSIYLLASVLAPLLEGGLMCELSIVGGFLILASGLSILKIKEIPTMNLLPALFVPPVWFAIAPIVGM